MFNAESKPQISEGKKKAFLVYDESLRDPKAKFYEFLRRNGYTYGTKKGSYGCPWAHVDITTKQYAYGMPGVSFVGELGNHAITISDFMTIYKIFEKYEGKGLFVFYETRFDCEKDETIFD